MPQWVDFLENFLLLNQFLGPPHGALCTPPALEVPVLRLRGRKSLLQDPFNSSFVHHFSRKPCLAWGREGCTEQNFLGFEPSQGRNLILAQFWLEMAWNSMYAFYFSIEHN